MKWEAVETWGQKRNRYDLRFKSTLPSILWGIELVAHWDSGQEGSRRTC